MLLIRHIFKLLLQKNIALTSSLVVIIIINHLFSYSCLAQVSADKIPFSPIGSLSLNTSTDWLKAYFGPKISDSIQIIGLGEVSHGSIEPMEFQTKMIQYLVEERGYRNIIFERSDTYILRLIRNYLNNNQFEDHTIEKLVKAGGFTSAATANALNLFSWLKKYNMKHPNDRVQIAGFDLNADNTFFNYVLNNYISPLNPEEGQKYAHRLSNVSDITRLQILRSWFDINENLLKRSYKQDDIRWLSFQLSNLEHAVRAFKIKNVNHDAWTFYRDSVMSENVKYLAQSKKAILIAHNGHLIKSVDGYMGVNLNKYYQSRYYVILTDFSRSAQVEVWSQQDVTNDKSYVTKTFSSNPTTAASEILQKFGIASGVFQHKDIVKYRVLDRTNVIDAYGLQQLSPANPKAFDCLVTLENLTVNGLNKP